MSDKVLERQTFQAGDTLFKEGDDGSYAFIIQTGEVQIIKSMDEDGEVILATVGPGGIIGEMALLDQANRMATVRATIGGAAIVISSQVFGIKMLKTDPFIRGLLLILADRVRGLSENQPKASEAPTPEAAPVPEATPDPAPTPEGDA